mmetsp:Transcript_11011/g.40729  ORF Transcript_11011/g.40729 Transcript_11011/m.40729 type:complete len:499 (-) Transcript_11011:342-1838(-)
MATVYLVTPQSSSSAMRRNRATSSRRDKVSASTASWYVTEDDGPSWFCCGGCCGGCGGGCCCSLCHAPLLCELLYAASKASLGAPYRSSQLPCTLPPRVDLVVLIVRTSVSVCHSSVFCCARSPSCLLFNNASASAQRVRAARAISSAAAALAFAALTSISRCRADASAASRASFASSRAATAVGETAWPFAPTPCTSSVAAAFTAIPASTRDAARSFFISARSAARARTLDTTSANCTDSFARASGGGGDAYRFGIVTTLLFWLPTILLTSACTPTTATREASAKLPIRPRDSALGDGTCGTVVETALVKRTFDFALAAPAPPLAFGPPVLCSSRSFPRSVSCATFTPPAVSKQSISAVSVNRTTDAASSGFRAKNARRRCSADSFGFFGSFFFLSSSSSPVVFFGPGAPGSSPALPPEDPLLVPGSSSVTSSSEPSAPSLAPPSASSPAPFPPSGPSFAACARATARVAFRFTRKGIALDATSLESRKASNGKLAK